MRSAGTLGLGLFLLLIAAVLLGPLLWRVDPHIIASDAMTLLRSRNQDPSWQAPLGTDQLGRDLLARVLAGGQITLAVGFVSMAMTLVIGASVGLIAGYCRRLDAGLMRLTDLFLALPLLPILLVLSMLFRERLTQVCGAELGAFLLITTAIGLTSWMQCARIIRAEVLSLRRREFVLAAACGGAGRFRVLCRHILPNIASPLICAAMLGFAHAVMTESAISVLGMGFPPDLPTWGRLVLEGSDYFRQAPMRALAPGLAIALAVLAVHLMADALREAMDPRKPD